MPDEDRLVPINEVDVDDEAELIPGFLSKRRRQKTQRLYVLIEITPTIIILGILFMIMFFSYPLWPIHSWRTKESLKMSRWLPEKSSKPSVPKFYRPNGTENLRCDWVFDNDLDFVNQLSKHRMEFKDPENLDMDCASIRARHYFPDKAASKEEADFGVARARIVYKDYTLSEMELAANYAPQNHYCYAIDQKADPVFHQRIQSLASCFPNVEVTKHEFKVDSAGHGMGPSFVQCLKLLATSEKEWKYVHLLQNHDTSLRINLDMVRILKWLNGSNDVEITSIPGGRVDTSLDWSFNALNLFQNKTRNDMKFNGYEPTLVFSKGYVESTLSRKMVDFMLNDLDLTELMRRIELKGFGIDEIMIPTLHASDAIAAPGGFTHYCYKSNTNVKHITRKSLWSEEGCNSKKMRHSICIYGVEDLVEHISKYPQMFVNKIMPEFDMAAVVCWYERLFNRTYIDPPTTERLDPNFYLNLAHIGQLDSKRNRIAKRKMVKQLNGTKVLNGLTTAKKEAELINHEVSVHKFNPKNYDEVFELAQTIKQLANLKFEPTVGIICGSGLGDLADLIKDPIVLPYSKIPGFPTTNVIGHKGNLVFGELAGKYVVCQQGRFHPYEHEMDLALCSVPVRIMHLLGVRTMVVSNAAGGFNPDFEFGDLMIIKDHIFMPGLCGFGPLVGLNDPRFGPRFVSVHDAYDVQLRKTALRIGQEQNIKLHEGVYVMSSGPQYETPSELYKVVGADALGMSTAHEVTVARQLSMRVLGFSLITNIANTDVENSVEVSHEEVLDAAAKASERACKFISQVLKEI